MSEIAENQYQLEAQSRWPQEHAESNRRLSRLTAVEQKAVFDLGPAITARIAEQFLAGAACDSVAVQALVAEHYAWIDNFWTPNQAAYIGLGDMYVADERFARNYESQATGLAEFMRQAMRHYAFAQLG